MKSLKPFTPISADELSQIDGGLLPVGGPILPGMLIANAIRKYFDHSIMDGVREGLGE